jgi:hypothetical protein
MYPSVTPLIRAAIKRRYELVPYTYSQTLLSHMSAIPPQRWTGWGYEKDPNVWSREIRAGDTQYWFGDALLIAGVYEAGKTSARLYLPQRKGDIGFLNTNAPFQYLAPGQWHEISAVWHDSIAVVARIGSLVPVGKAKLTTSCEDEGSEFAGLEKDNWRGVEIFPPPITLSFGADGDLLAGRVFRSVWYEDDGISAEAASSVCNLDCSYSVSPIDIVVGAEACFRRSTEWKPLWLENGLDIVLPVGEDRQVSYLDGDENTVRATDVGRDAKGRRVWRVAVSVKI